MKKNFIVLIVILMFLAFCFAGCKSADQNTSDVKYYVYNNKCNCFIDIDSVKLEKGYTITDTVGNEYSEECYLLIKRKK